MKLVPAAAFAIACSTTTLFAQTPAPVAAAPMTQPTTTQTPVAVPAMTAPSAQSPTTGTDHSTAIVLLDRIQKVLDTAVDDKKGKDGAISIDRGLIDELRAEITQVRMSLEGEKK